MAITAPCQLEENVIIDPRADAADAGIGENVQTAALQHAPRLPHGLFGIRIVMEALRAGDNIEALVRIGQFISGTRNKLRAGNRFSLCHADHLLGQIQTAVACGFLPCKQIEQKPGPAAYVQQRFIGNAFYLLCDVASAYLSVLRIVIGIALVIFGGLPVKMLPG